MDATPEMHVEDGQGTVRLSMLACGSLLLAVLALVAGCGSVALAMAVWPQAVVVAMAAPVAGLISVVLGFVALRRIEHSEGRLMGRPMGIGGLFLGVLAAAILGFMAMAALLTLNGSKTLAPVAAELVASAQEGKPARVRELLSQDASNDVSAGRLGAFGGILRTTKGRVTGSDAGFDLIYEARRITASSSGQTSMSLSDAPRPVWMYFDDVRHFAYVWANQDALAAKQVRLDDLLIVVDVNKVVVLRAYGPAQTLADGMGWEVMGP